MAHPLQQIALGLFALMMAAAAVADYRRLIIPNLLTLGLCALWPVYAVVGMTLVGALEAIGCALAIFAVGIVLFARGCLGGGDVKLLAAAALWAGPGATLALLAGTGLLGGVLALILITPLGARLAASHAAAARAHDATEPATATKLQAPIPYGVAIAAAAVTTIVLPHFR